MIPQFLPWKPEAKAICFRVVPKASGIGEIRLDPQGPLYHSSHTLHCRPLQTGRRSTRALLWASTTATSIPRCPRLKSSQNDGRTMTLMCTPSSTTPWCMGTCCKTPVAPSSSRRWTPTGPSRAPWGTAPPPHPQYSPGPQLQSSLRMSQPLVALLSLRVNRTRFHTPARGR